MDNDQVDPQDEPREIPYSAFMRARRPELYSDTMVSEESSADRNYFGYQLHTLTERKEEYLFENFCRALAEKEICPNLIPQTGPTGGGDGKTDTETYPVSEEISDRWYVGGGFSKERWAFAFSAKEDWKTKVGDDVKKICGTGRPYTLIYFISNQAIKDKDCRDYEDKLTQQYGVPVRILGRAWIVDKVAKGRRWDLVEEFLNFQLPGQRKVTPGPLDTGRQLELAEVEKRIEGAPTGAITLELIDDCLRSALLSRSLGHPRTEVDGKFERAERMARQANDPRQLHRIRYQRAWTTLWWFDDVAEVERLYDLMAQDALTSEWAWDLEDLVNLWLAVGSQQLRRRDARAQAWALRTAALSEALRRLADAPGKRTNALWARAQRLLMRIMEARWKGEPLGDVLDELRQIFDQADQHFELPVEPLTKIVRELGDVLPDDAAYDALFERVVALESKRNGNAAEGELRLDRGRAKLTAGKTSDAINQLAQAQFLLAQDEHRGKFIAAVAATGSAYEQAGLLWAARANLLFALDRCLYSFFKEGSFDERAFPLLRRVIWVELQLGRVGVLNVIELLRLGECWVWHIPGKTQAPAVELWRPRIAQRPAQKLDVEV